MHITIDPYPASFGGMYTIIGIFGFLGLVGMITALVFLIRGFTIEGTLAERITGLIGAIVFIVFGSIAAVNIVSVVTQSNTLNAAFNKQLSQQISERYQLDLTSQQLHQLDYTYLNGYEPSPIGTTQVLMDNTITEISLYHVGDKWLLADTSDSKQITELPTYNQ